MRITNSMLVNNFMRNLNSNLTRMDGLQNMLATGRKFAHISDDPSALIYSQAARNNLARLSHYQRTVQSAQDRLEQAEAGLMELQRILADAYVETINASTDVKTDSDRQNISAAIGQLREHFIVTLNTTFGDKYVFSGYNSPGDSFGGEVTGPFTVSEDGQRLLFNGFDLTAIDGMTDTRRAEIDSIDLTAYPLPLAPPGTALDFTRVTIADLHNPNLTTNDLNALLEGPGAPFPGLTDAQWDALRADQEFNDKLTMNMFDSLLSDVLTFDVGPAISMPVSVNGIDVVFFRTTNDDGEVVIRNIFNVINDLYNATKAPGSTALDVNIYIKPLREGQNHLLTKTAEIGGKTRRLELLEARYEQDIINYSRMKSDAEDVDFAEAIMLQKMAEAVYQASLSTGARIIQPTLMDFLR